MTHQISRYLASNVAQEPKNTSLYVLWTGVNDIRLLFEEESDDLARRSMVDAIAASISNDLVSSKRSFASRIFILIS